MNSTIEYLAYYSVRIFGFVVRHLPLRWALGVGRIIGGLGYYFDIRHRSLAYANLKVAFAKTKTPEDIRRITKTFFQNYGQNLIEIFRLPLFQSGAMDRLVTLKGEEHLKEALLKKKGVILLAMHFGSWELASRIPTRLGYPYKMIVKHQRKFSRLYELLNSYREAGGSVVISRGSGTRELIKSLHNNEVVGMVVDQGGKDGMLVPFFGRRASLSVGAVRLALKWDVPLCFSIIVRQPHGRHWVTIQEPLELDKTGDLNQDLMANLTKLTKIMEHYITRYPAEYMWFYKIWKYSNQATIVILNDGKKGHLNQSQALAKTVEAALAERGIQSQIQIIDIGFQNSLKAKWIPVLSCLVPAFLSQGRLEFLDQFLTPESFRRLTAVKADFIISCGSAVAPLNHLLSRDYQAKSLCVLKPGSLSFQRFDLVVLPQHDRLPGRRQNERVVTTRGAPNLIGPEYLREQSELLLKRFSHLRSRAKKKIGVFLGGDNKNYCFPESLAKIVVDQIKEIAEEMNADILVTTSRRTPARVENLLLRELKKHPRCPLLILANRLEVPEAVGGILGLSDILVVSGDSVSMISEAASSGKNTIVFSIKKRKGVSLRPLKHDLFVEKLNDEGFILACEAQSVGRFVSDVAKNKITTKPLNDQPALLKAVREII